MVFHMSLFMQWESLFIFYTPDGWCHDRQPYSGCVQIIGDGMGHVLGDNRCVPGFQKDRLTNQPDGDLTFSYDDNLLCVMDDRFIEICGVGI